MGGNIVGIKSRGSYSTGGQCYKNCKNKDTKLCKKCFKFRGKWIHYEEDKPKRN